MKLTRRHFLSWAGLAAVGAVACEGFGIREGELDIQSPVALPEDLVRGKDNWYTSLCRNCPSAEGIVVRVMEGRAKKVQGNPYYPTNQGKSHARCEANVQALYHPDRIPSPMRRSGPRGAGQFSPISWDPQAFNILRDELRVRGGNAVLVTEPLRGHMGKLVGTFADAIGAEHLGFEPIDNNTLRAAVKNVYRQDVLPDFDLEHANFVLSFGADFLSTWVSPTRWNRGYGEFRQGHGRERGTLYHVDSRFSMTAANADRWIAIRPGWEGHLAMSLAQVIIAEGLQAPGIDVDNLLGGAPGRQALDNFRPEAVVQQIGLTAERAGGDPVEFIKQLARDFASKKPSLAIGGGSAGAGTNGLFNLEAIYALNYLVGSVGAEGGVILNPASPWDDVPAGPKTGSLDDWERITGQIRSGETTLLMLHNADLVHGTPESLRLNDAIVQADDLVVVSFSSFIDDTSALADLLLPDRASLEDWGNDIPEPGPGYQVVGFQQPVVNPLFEIDPQSFADVLLTMAQELGRDQDLPWANYKAMLREAADDLFASGRGSIDAGSSDEFWHKLLQTGGWWDETSRGPADRGPEDGLLRRIAESASSPTFAGFGPGAGIYYLVPFPHNTIQNGTLAHLPWLQAAPDPITSVTWQTWVEMNDITAEELGVKEGDVIRIESSQGSVRALAYLTPAVPPDTVAVPFGGGRRHGSAYATDRLGNESSNVLDILEPTRVAGPGSLAWAGTMVRLHRTDDHVAVSKLEGDSRAVEVALSPAEEIIKTVHPDDI